MLNKCQSFDKKLIFINYSYYLTIIIQKTSYSSIRKKEIKAYNLENNLPDITLIWAEYIEPRKFGQLLVQKMSGNNTIDFANRIELVERIVVINEFNKNIIIEKKREIPKKQGDIK